MSISEFAGLIHAPQAFDQSLQAFFRDAAEENPQASSSGTIQVS